MSPEAARITYWQAQMEIIAEAVIADGYVNPEWRAMRRRLLRLYADRWREACDEMRMKEAA